MADNIGTWFEGKLKEALETIQYTHKSAMYHRFPDSKAARNYLQKQPGDYLLLIEGLPILIEAKCSEVHDSLRAGFSSMFEKPQATQHFLWQRGGGRSWVVFCNRNTEQVEFWDSAYLHQLRVQGKRIPKSLLPEYVAPLKTLKDCILSMVAYEHNKL